MGGPPKIGLVPQTSSILIGVWNHYKSSISGGTTIFGNTHIDIDIVWLYDKSTAPIPPAAINFWKNPAKPR